MIVPHRILHGMNGRVKRMGLLRINDKIRIGHVVSTLFMLIIH